MIVFIIILSIVVGLPLIAVLNGKIREKYCEKHDHKWYDNLIVATIMKNDRWNDLSWYLIVARDVILQEKKCKRCGHVDNKSVKVLKIINEYNSYSRCSEDERQLSLFGYVEDSGKYYELYKYLKEQKKQK